MIFTFSQKSASSLPLKSLYLFSYYNTLQDICNSCLFLSKIAVYLQVYNRATLISVLPLWGIRLQLFLCSLLFFTCIHRLQGAKRIPLCKLSSQNRLGKNVFFLASIWPHKLYPESSRVQTDN